ncbi:RiPP maturation radical SAM C-methyltransferase [Rhodovulum sulfidophilum]|uniref:RiPP maturation radical SAM C-methyltransferase n=1 Tax=Rhodovulum sulfidophilum TaxID=35806 RepID=UPI001923FB91|nr:RiPP maturation radical SAM C-methyltransferase [Rhodovulum sulfidophilum]MBL3562442.1 RiPP maturation radical SAM C-methyltransferase [Rhodovulum sulfidophilum]
MRVLLLSMPFGALDRPALGLSLLKPALAAAGHKCDVAYAFEPLVETIGADTYQWLSDDVPYTAFPGDWCFTLPLYGRHPNRDWAYVTDILRDEWQMTPAEIRRVVQVREATPAYLDRVEALYDWGRYDVVGFTSTFVQNLASLALAKRLKRRYPHLRLVFGGANWEGQMGQALFETFEFVDHVCQGEADESFPALIGALAAGRMAPRIPGALSRGVDPVGARPFNAMDRLPLPDFSDYFAMRERLVPDLPATLLMETSRGCWWGAKHHCTFCGLNGEGMGFRVKSPDRALAEFDHVGAYPGEMLSVVDNILDMSYFGSVLPELAKSRLEQPIFYETKANLSRAQVRGLRDAGILTIQPGIENLSDRVLKLMRKGTTGLRNIQLLKWAREYGVGVEWNILYGFPGETDADYDETFAILPKIAHLQAPSGIGPVRIDRFAPYFETPEAFGIRSLRPLRVFDHLYPVADDVKARIACYFDAEHGASLASPELVARLGRAVEAWRGQTRAELRVADEAGRMILTDKRRGRPMRHTLTGADRLIYLACDKARSIGGIAKTLARHGRDDVSEDRIAARLGDLAAADLVIESGGVYLSLGVFDRYPAECDPVYSDRIAEEA